MPDKPADSSARSSLKKPRKRGWLRRLFKWLGIFLLIVAIFHRPLVHWGVRFALIKVASKQNVTLDLHFGGTIWTNLTISDVLAVPNGKGPSPVGKISIGAVRLDYSLSKLLKKNGVGEFLQSYELHNADIVINAIPSKTVAEKQQKKSLAEDLNNLLAQPALYADKVNIDHFSIAINALNGKKTEVRDLQLYLHPWDSGYLRVAHIAIPGLPNWDNIDAKTSYVGRNLFIQNLVLSPELVIAEYNFDASQRSQNKGGMQLKANLFGGFLQLGLSGSQLNAKGENLAKSYDTTLKLDVSDIDVKAATKYFGAPQPPVGKLEWLKLVFTGEPEKPKTWKGNIAVRADGIAAGALAIDSVQSFIDLKDGIASIFDTRVAIGSSAVALDGTAELPASVNEFPKTEGDINIAVDSPDLASLTAAFIPKDPVGGALTGKGKVNLHQQRATADFELTGNSVGTAAYAMSTAWLRLNAVKALNMPAGSAPFDGLESKVSLKLGEIWSSAVTADKITVDAQTRNEVVSLQGLEVIRGENKVSATGTYKLARQKGDPSPINADFAIHAPSLHEFTLGKNGYVLSGRLDATGKVETDAKNSLAGSVTLDGGDFRYGEFKAAKLAGKVHLADDTANIEQLEFQIDGKSQIAVSGKVGLKETQKFEGAALVLFHDLAVLQPLLETFGVTEPIGGSLDFSVEGEGTLKPLAPAGNLKIKVAKAFYGNFKLDEFRLATLFSQEFVESTDFFVDIGATTLGGKLAWRDKKLSLKEINLMQGTQQALSGYIILPLDPSNPQQKIPYDQRLGANVNVKDLDVAKLMQSLGKPAPVNGTVSMNLLLAGTVLKPIMHMKVAAKNIKNPSAAKLDAAEVEIAAHYSGGAATEGEPAPAKELTVDITARQKEIQPLVIKGKIPFDMEATLQNKKIDPDAPIDVTVNLPPSSLAFVPKVAEAVRSLAGTAAIQAHITGTVGKPQLAGSANLKIEYARMNAGGVPNIGASQVSLAFTENSVNIQKIHLDMGGGTLDVLGKILFPKITEPAFDLQIKSDEVLAMRNESVTVRVDSDIKISGPLAGGAVKGTVWVTHSKFFREIEILPIALPGRPKPKAQPAPRSAPSGGGPAISLPPMLAKWTFDIAIKTRPDDLFLVRGNLANGGAAVDLHFGGTGAEPFLEGVVRIENLVATLPFSKLTITRGMVSFTKDEMLQPTLDITAESDIREYHISIAIYGKASDPQLSMTSEPPLAQQDLLSLLATGTTLGELTGNADVIAGRAASLLFQQLYRKIFKKKADSENTPVLNRFEVEVGGVDNRTGRQAINGSFKLNDNLYLLGNMNVAGEFSGRVRYLLRFR